jgi:hypothetical protein
MTVSLDMKILFQHIVFVVPKPKYYRYCSSIVLIPYYRKDKQAVQWSLQHPVLPHSLSIGHLPVTYLLDDSEAK